MTVYILAYVACFLMGFVTGCILYYTVTQKEVKLWTCPRCLKQYNTPEEVELCIAKDLQESLNER